MIKLFDYMDMKGTGFLFSTDFEQFLTAQYQRGYISPDLNGEFDTSMSSDPQFVEQQIK